LRATLNITGDDGITLINKFGKKFNVDVSNFKSADYFHPQPATLFISKKRMIKALTVW